MLLERGDEGDIELTDIETVDVFAEEVDHVAMGHAEAARIGDERELTPPIGTGGGDETVVVAFDRFNEEECGVEREMRRAPGVHF